MPPNFFFTITIFVSMWARGHSLRKMPIHIAAFDVACCAVEVGGLRGAVLGAQAPEDRRAII